MRGRCCRSCSSEASGPRRSPIALDQCLRNRKAAIESMAAPRGSAAPRPPARRDRTYCLDQCLRKGYTAAKSLAARRGNAPSRPPARRDHLQRVGRCLRKGHIAAASLEFLETMLHQGLLPDRIIPTPWSVPREGKAAAKTLELLEARRYRCLLPDEIIYNTLVSACEKGNAAAESP